MLPALCVCRGVMRMRKLLCAACLLVIPVLFIVSCSEKPPKAPDQLMVSVAANAQITQGESALTCSVTRNSEGIAVITVSQPSLLNGMSFEWRGDGYGISYNGLACKAEQPFLPSTSFASAIINVFSACENIDALVIQSQEGEKTTYSGSSESGRFEVVADNSDGFIEKLTVPDLKLTVDFTRWES